MNPVYPYTRHHLDGMRSSTTLVYTSPSPARKPAFKRRRLNHAVDPGYQLSRALTDNSNTAPTPNAPPPSPCAKLSCSTCHRVLSMAVRPGGASPSMCSRCSALTCAICARTCTSYTHPPSFPPTPALTRSPTPSVCATTPVSPKRSALSLNHAAMNCDASVALAAPSTKRKKAPVDKEDIDGASEPDGHAGCDHLSSISTFGSGGDAIVIHGCGRVVCRACCVESVPNDGKLCIDCYAFV